MKASCIYVRCGLPDFLKIAFSSKEQSWFLYLELTIYFLPSLFLWGSAWSAASSTASRKGRGLLISKELSIGKGSLFFTPDFCFCFLWGRDADGGGLSEPLCHAHGHPACSVRYAGEAPASWP